MKKIISILSFLLAINFASAADLSEMLSQIDQSLVVLMALFIITFSVSFFSLNKIFKDNKTMAGVMAGTVAFLAVYGINKIEFNTPDFFYNLGISESAFSLGIFIAITAGIIYMFTQLGKDTLVILGTVLMALSFFVYAKALLMTVGIILLVVWFFISVNKNSPTKRGHTTSSSSSSH